MLKKNKVLPKPNLSFINKIIPGFRDDFGYVLSGDLYVSGNQFYVFSNIKLYEFKFNNLIKNNNYIWYLLNTSNNLLTSCCFEQIRHYYEHLLTHERPGNGYMVNEYKYGLVSLYHKLGKRLVRYCIKSMYSQYTNHFMNLRLSGEPYKKYSIKISERNLELAARGLPRRQAAGG